MAEPKKKTAKKAPAKKKAAPKKKAPTKAKAKVKAESKKVAPKFILNVGMMGRQRTLEFTSENLRDAAYEKLHLRSKYLGDANMLRPVEVDTGNGVVLVHRVSSVVK